jgi:hypothetical protein
MAVYSASCHRLARFVRSIAPESTVGGGDRVIGDSSGGNGGGGGGGNALKVLGCHIEMAADGTEYPTGTLFQPVGRTPPLFFALSHFHVARTLMQTRPLLLTRALLQLQPSRLKE